MIKIGIGSVRGFYRHGKARFVRKTLTGESSRFRYPIRFVLFAVTLMLVSLGQGQTLIPRTNWSLHYFDSQETVGENGAATNAFDGDSNTFWITQWLTANPKPPHEIQINLGAIYSVSGFRYLTRQDQWLDGSIGKYEFYVSADGVNWGAAVATGTFAKSRAEKQILFSAKSGKYVRLRGLTEVSGSPWSCVAELNVLQGGVANQAPDGSISAPAADLTIASGQSVSFAGSGTDSDNNTPLTYLWDFGAGSGIANSTAQNPGSQQFNSPGTYAVTLTVTDSLGSSDPTPATRTVTVTGTSGSAIPRTGWSLRYVDSQETVGENGTATNAFDGDPNTFWITQWLTANPKPPHEIQINLGAVYNINGFRYLTRQDQWLDGSIGQYEFYVSADGVNWGSAVATGTFAKSKTEKLVNFNTVSGRYVRLRALTETSGSPWSCVAELNVLQGGVANQAPDSSISAPSTNVTITVGQSVSFTGNGTDPDGNTPFTYLWNFGTGSGIANSTAQNPGSKQFNSPGTYTVTFAASDSLGQSDPTPATRVVTVQSLAGNPIPHTGWTLHYVDSQETVGENGAATNAFDGNSNTFWITQWLTANPLPPHEIQINLGTTQSISGFRYLTRQDNYLDGSVGEYEFYVSADGVNWGSALATGTFANSKIEKQALFNTVNGQYVRLRALSEAGGWPWSCVAELDVLQGGTGNQTPDGSISAPSGNMTIATGQSVNFSGSGADPDGNTPVAYLWNFGSGSGIANSTAQNPGTIQFNNPGTYKVTFTVTDALGLPDPTPVMRTVNVLSSAAIPIARTAWMLQSFSSQETSIENGKATNAFDGNSTTHWSTKVVGVGSRLPHPHDLQIDMGAVYNVSGFRYLPRQDGYPNGGIHEYEFYVSLDGVNWGAPAATGGFVRSLLEVEVLFAAKSARFVWMRALSEINDEPFTTIGELNVLKTGTATNQPANGTINFPTGNATILAGSTIDFNATGTDLDGDLPLTYRWSCSPGSGIDDINLENPGPVRFNIPGTYKVTFTVADARGAADPTPATIDVTVLGGTTSIPKTNWSLKYVDSQELVAGNYAATKAFDGSSSTFWHTGFSGPKAQWTPHEIQIDLGAAYDIGGFRYLPRQDGNMAGNIGDYRFYVSADGTNWSGLASFGTFADTSAEKEVLSSVKYGRFVKFFATTEADGLAVTTVAELGILGAQSITPSVNLVTPTSNYMQTSPNLYVLARASLSNGQGVRMTVDGGTANGGVQFDDFTAPYEVSFTGLNTQPHTIDAYVITPAGALVNSLATRDRAVGVGVGDYYVAIGDSITFGEGDNVLLDNVSLDGRNFGGGFTPILANLLASSTGLPQVIANEGVPGVQTSYGIGRIGALLQKHSNARHFLVMYGTNDAGNPAIPTGLGLKPGDTGYVGSYKYNMQRIINDINAAGKTVALAKMPVVLPLNGQIDLRVQQFNRVIDELVADPANLISISPPDFHAYFATHLSQYTDSYHPNGAGYQAMANLWFQALPR